MKTLEEKKKMAFELLVPYYKDPTTCAVEIKTTNGETSFKCKYYMLDGRMCVAGKCMLDPVGVQENVGGAIGSVLLNVNYDQSKVFKPEFVDVFTKEEWGYIQGIHDEISRNKASDLSIRVRELVYRCKTSVNQFFEFQEFINYCDSN